MPCVENLVSYCFVLFVLIHVDSTRVKLIIIVLYTDKLAKKMKIKKENYGPYDDDTVNGEKQPEEVKSDGGVKIKEEETDNEWVEGYATSYQSVSWLNYLFRVVVNLSKERIDYQMAAVGGIRIEFFVVVLVVNIMWCRLACVFYFAISTIDVAYKNSMYTKASIVMTDRLRCFDLELLKRRKTTSWCRFIYLPIFM